MAHTKEDEELLNYLSEQDKLDRTTKKAFIKKGSLVKDFVYWYLAANEMPDPNRGDKQYVLRIKNKGFSKERNKPYGKAMVEFLRILDIVGLPCFVRNSGKSSSVKRYHLHIFN